MYKLGVSSSIVADADRKSNTVMPLLDNSKCLVGVNCVLVDVESIVNAVKFNRLSEVHYSTLASALSCKCASLISGRGNKQPAIN